MKKQTGYLIIIWLALLSLMLSACNASANKVPTLTFESNKCSYSGPTTLPSDFTLTWNIKDNTSTGYIYLVLTLGEGKNLDDLKTALASPEDQPEWVNLISRDLSAKGNAVLTKEHNLVANGLYHGEPIYLACLSYNMADAVGPITIKD